MNAQIDHRNTRTSPVTAPVAAPSGLVADVDVARPLPEWSAIDTLGARQLWVLVRVFTEPLGNLLLDLGPDGLSARQLATAIEAEFGDQIRQRAAAAGGEIGATLPVDGITTLIRPPYQTSRDALLRTAPPITVVVCTRNRPDDLRRGLASLQAQRYPDFRILVVDNSSPGDNSTLAVVRQARARTEVDYLRETRPGLSRARNAAVAATPGEILAFFDDDADADPHWLAEIARAFADHPEADAVSGPVVPAELVTDAQLWFEQFGGHSKGRGFTPAVFSPATRRRQNPLYPLPPFGVGANMAFRPDVIEGIGGFDEALGAGTPAMGSEDTLAFMSLLHGGGTMVYQPSAVVRHYHRSDVAGLRKQLYGYGMGLTAAYVGLLRRRPWLIFSLAALVPTALRDLLSPSSRRVEGLRDDFPRELLKANREGMLRGPRAYLAGRRALS